MSEADERAAYERVICKKAISIRDFDIDAFADGVLAHREGEAFHENPHGAHALTLRRLSWTLGWNQRALAAGEGKVAEPAAFAGRYCQHQPACAPDQVCSQRDRP